ncbi:MAG TPA: pitrilysin family protein [Bacteroidota bacterium]|nr:pitrilysin family protein [Bacteroidota bacterium]
MIRSLWIFFFLIVPVVITIAQEKKESKIFPYPIYQETLDNGLKIVSIPFDSPGIIAYYTVVRTGSRNEVEPGKSGFAHFFEHMMFRGTERYSKDQYNDMLKSIGADHNAFTSDDETVYHILSSSDALETIMDIESDRFMNLKYTEEDFKTEAGAILGEYNKNYSNPFMTIFEKMREAAYENHTYKHTTMGFLKDIQDMPNQYQYSLTFFDRWYRPENCVLVIVGDIDPKKLVAFAKKYYGSWKRGTFTLDVPLDPPQKEEKNIELPWKAKTLPILSIGYRGPAFSDKDLDMPAMDLLSQVVFSRTSDLYRKLVIEEQLVENIGGGQNDSRDPGLFIISARIKDPKNNQRVREAINAAIENAKTVPVSMDRLTSIKSYLKYQYAMGLDNPDRVAGSISNYVQLTGDPESVNRVYALYDLVTPEDIMNAAKKYFTMNNRTVVLLTHQEESKSQQEVKP